MSATESAVRNIDFFKLVRATEGLSQRRPLIVGFATILVAILVGFFSAYLARSVDNGTFKAILSLLGAAGAFIVLTSGFSAVGVLLMDQAKSVPQRSMQDAFVFGLMCLPRFIGFGLLMLALAVVVLLAAALVYFICKIPGVGPLLFFVAHPVLVVISGLIFAAVVWVGVPLIAPSIWEGRTLKESISVLIAVAKERLVVVVLSFLALYIVVGVVASLVAGVLFAGYFSMSGLAVGILGSDVLSGGGTSPLSLFESLFGGGYGGEYGHGSYGSGSGSGYLYAGLAASFLIFSVAGALLTQVLIMGLNLVYLTVTEGLDIAARQAEMEKKLAELKQKAKEAQERARQAAEGARQSAQKVPKPAPPTPHQNAAPPASVSSTSAMESVGASPQASASACPNCKAPIAADDLFCGECGHRLNS